MSNYDPFPDPFADPTISQVASKPNQTQSSLDDYSPFTNNSTPAVLQTTTGTSESSSTSRTDAPPTYQPVTKTQITHDELQRRQEELERKAAELAAREDALRQQQNELGSGGSGPAPNWPPLPSLCPIKPCLYQDINIEIAPPFQNIVRYAYNLWVAYVAVLLINALGRLALVVKHNMYSEFFVSVFVLCVFSPVSFLCWFRPLYKAFRSDSSFNFMVFFFIFFCHLVISVLYALGIPESSCGLFTVLGNLGEDAFLSLFLILVCTCLILYAVAALMILMRVHKIYGSTGASFQKAQEEFTTNVMRNQTVQNAASNFVQGAARQTVSQMFTGGPNATATANPEAGQVPSTGYGSGLKF